MSRLKVFLATFLCLATLFAWAVVPVIPLPKKVVESHADLSRDYSAITIKGSVAEPSISCAIEQLRALAKGKGAKLTVTLQHDKSITNKQGYRLTLKGNTALVQSPTDKGAFYALQSLKQLLRADYRNDVIVGDYPDFDTRIFFDDISRGATPNVEFIKSQIAQLAELKYTHLTFYIEHVVRVSCYPDFAPENGHLTMADVREICRYAALHNMEVIGSFQSFGHFDNILAVEKYAHLGDTPSMIAPLNPDAQKFLREVIGELCDNFNSDYFNINCDETWDLTNGKSKDYVARVGADKFYADHVRFLYDVIKAKGKRTMVWADIIMKYPTIIDMLPHDIIYLPWEYGRQKSFEPWLKPFADAKADFMVCPGALNSTRLLPDMRMARGNMDFIRAGYKAGAKGVIYTTWDDPATLHLFTHLWYSAFLGAETIWNASQQTVGENFDARFCLQRLGDKTTAFVATLDTLYRMSDIGMTYNMNDRVFYDRFVPEKGGTLSYNLPQIEAIAAVAADAQRSFDKIHATRNPFDIESLKYTIDQYRFIASSRLSTLAVSKLYSGALVAPDADKLLTDAAAKLIPLQLAVDSLAAEFRRGWLYENQPYSLDLGLGQYAFKSEQIAQMSSSIEAAKQAVAAHKPISTAQRAGLDIKSVNSNYFGYWLSCGGFPNGDINVDALASVGGELTQQPTPGQRFAIGGAEYKWTRHTSPNAFVLDFTDLYPSQNNGLAYATVQIFSPKAQSVEALLGCSGRVKVLCNGKEIFASPTEDEFTADKYRVTLPLNEGANRLIIKSQQLVTKWQLSFRLDDKDVNASKQRYYLAQ